MLTLLALRCAQAEVPAPYALRLDPGQQEWLREKQTLVVGMPASNWAPYSYYSGKDHYQGLLHDDLQTVSQRLGLRLHYRAYPTFNDAQLALRSGEVDALAGVAITPQRQTWMHFTAPLIEIPRAVLLGKPGKSPSLAQATQMQWVCERGYDSCDLLEHLGFKKITRVDVNTEALFMVKYGLADAYLSDRPYLESSLPNQGVKARSLVEVPWIDPVQLALTTAGNNVRLGELLSLAVDSLTPQDKHALLRLADAYNKPKKKARKSSLFTSEESAWIAAHPEVSFAPGPWVGLGQIDKNGRFSGLVADLLTLIERRSGLRFTLHPTQGQNSLVMVEEGKLALAPTVVNLPARRQHLLFTSDYLTLKRLLISNNTREELSSLKELKGARVAASSASADITIISAWQAEPVPFFSFDEQLTALATGKVDYILASEGINEQLLRRGSDLKLHIAYSGNELDVPMAMAVAKDNPMLASILNKALGSVSPQEMQLLQDKWFNLKIETGINRTQLLRIVLGMIVGILLVALLGYLWNRSLSREVRQRQRAEAQLSHQLQLMETLLDTLPNMVVLTNEHLEITITNRAYRQFYLGGADTHGDYAALLTDILPFEVILRIQGEDARVWESGEDLHSQEAWQSDGSERLITYHKRLFRGPDGEKAGILTVLTDTTEQLHAQARAKEAEARLARLTNSIPGFVFQFQYLGEGQGHFQYVSAGYQEMDLRTREELLTNQYHDLFPHLDEQLRSLLLTELERQLNEENRVDLSFPSRLVNGQARTLQVRGNVTRQLDGHAVLYGMVQDITAMNAQQRALEEARQKAEAATQARDRFLATMSHELRTPIAGMHGMLELLRLGQLSEDQHYLVRNVVSSANNLLYLVNDILDYSKMEAGQLHLDPRSVRLAEVLCAVVRSNVATARQKGLQVQLLWDPALPDRAELDPNRLEQIFSNLLHNAIKFTERGGITLTLAYQDQRLWLRVEDTGIGIPPERLARLFNPFEQGETSISRRFGGSGLGLAISRNLAERMGGQLSLESDPGQGTRAILSLPLPEPRWEEKPLAGSRWQVSASLYDGAALLRSFGAEVRLCEQGGSLAPGLLLLDEADLYRLCPPQSLNREGAFDTPELQGHRIIFLSEQESLRTSLHQRHCLRLGSQPLYPDLLLESCLELTAPHGSESLVTPSIQRLRGRVLVAEDHPINRALLQRQLSLLGVEFELCENGRLALDAWQKGHFDLLLTDCHMPALDGYRLTAALRDLGVTAPIIGVTADASREVSRQSDRAGMTQMLYKPYTLEDLGRILGEYLMPAPELAPGVPAGSAMRERWIALFGGETVARTLAAEYVNSNGIDLARLQGSLPELAWDRLFNAAHSIMGAAQMTGESELAELAQAVEHCCKQQQAAPLAELVRRLQGRMQAIGSEIGAWLNEQPPL
ncbi:ATP-binding protein [Aeromonas aquatica]|uniref:ATP-binding protein n=1 Tax=Aeromonas aquatica TaxID=558964 RepID=UPI00126A70E0|nr:transporter substrate-binding domain-containing protein [Aeromonas aquatica]